MAPVQCKNPETCSSTAPGECAGRLVWRRIYTGIKDALDDYTLDDMVKEYNELHSRG